MLQALSPTPQGNILFTVCQLSTTLKFQKHLWLFLLTFFNIVFGEAVCFLCPWSCPLFGDFHCFTTNARKHKFIFILAYI